MPTIAANLPVVISQLPVIEHVAAAQQSLPEIQQVVATQFAQAMLKQQGSQVQKIEKDEAANAASPDADDRPAPEQRARERNQSEEDEGEPHGEHTASPFTGNILNMRV